MTKELVIQHLVDAVSLGALYALYALGIALIFGIMKLVNFAHGELIMVAAYALVLLANLPWPLLILVAISVSVVLALAMDRVAFRPARGASPATLLVTSFAVSYLLQSLAMLILGGLPRGTTFSVALTQSFSLGGVAIPKLDVVSISVTAIAVFLLAVFFAKTTIGVQMRAAAEDFDTARMLGVRGDRVIATAFALSGVLAGAAAILLVAQTGTVTPMVGVNAVLYAFIATVIGGLGSLPGAALGGFALGVVSVLFQASLPVSLRPYRDAFVFGLVAIVLVVKPDGFLASQSTRMRI